MDAMSVAAKGIRKALETALDREHITDHRKTIILFVYDNSMFYVTWCYSNKKDPTSKQALREFLETKSMLTAKFLADMTDAQFMNDALALLSFVRDLQKHAKAAEVPIVGVAVMIGLYVQDLAQFLVDFEPAQRAYYELVLRRM
jgi:hypothetical protein